MVAGKNAGRSGRRWRALVQRVRARDRVCYRCRQPIDWSVPYRDPETGEVNPDSGSVDHVVPLSIRPDLAEDLANLAAAHLQCNQAAGAKTAQSGGLGVASEAW